MSTSVDAFYRAWAHFNFLLFLLSRKQKRHAFSYSKEMNFRLDCGNELMKWMKPLGGSKLVSWWIENILPSVLLSKKILVLANLLSLCNYKWLWRIYSEICPIRPLLIRTFLLINTPFAKIPLIFNCLIRPAAQWDHFCTVPSVVTLDRFDCAYTGHSFQMYTLWYYQAILSEKSLNKSSNSFFL